MFKDYFGVAWDAASREQVVAAVRMRTDGFLMFREFERVAVGVAALVVVAPVDAVDVAVIAPAA